MDLSEIDIPDTAEIHIEVPGQGKLYADEGRTKPSMIVVYGPASPQAIELGKKLRRDIMQRMQKKGQRGVFSGDPESDEIDRLCALTADVQNVIYKGKPVKRETVREIYSDPKLGFIREQVREKLAGWEDFLGD